MCLRMWFSTALSDQCSSKPQVTAPKALLCALKRLVQILQSRTAGVDSGARTAAVAAPSDALKQLCRRGPHSLTVTAALQP
jgi:hypothetical protein